MLSGGVAWSNNLLEEKIKSGISIKAFGIGSKNYPSNYGTVVFIAYDDRSGNLWITAISNGTESEGSWINHKTNDSDWTGWEKISTVK